MANINLLPWREELRRQKTIEFSAMTGVIAAGAILIVLGARFHVGTLVDHQKTRNQYLQTQIDILKTKLEKIKDLEKTKQNLLARMEIVQDLQSSRPGVVHLFEELVITVPEGTWLTSIKQTENNLNIKGQAESHARVSTYMRNLEASPWLKDPVLEIIDSTDDENRNSSFILQLTQESPNKKDDEDE